MTTPLFQATHAYDLGSYGIPDDGNYVIASGNEVYSSSNAGIDLNYSFQYGTVSNNIVDSGGGDGMLVAGTNTNDVMVSGNMVTRATDDGMEIYAADDCVGALGCCSSHLRMSIWYGSVGKRVGC